MNSIEVCQIYKMSGIDVICVGFTRKGYAKMQTIGITAGKWPGKGNISDYNDVTHEFTKKWEGVIKKFKLPTLKEANKNWMIGHTLMKAAKRHSWFRASGSCAWLGTVGSSGCAWCVGSGGGIGGTSNQSNMLIVAPIFNLDTSKIVIDEKEIKRKSNEDSETIETKDVQPGTSILVGDMILDVLDNHYMSYNGSKGVLCLAKYALFDMAFDDSNSNNWRTSTLRRYLNDEFRNDFEAKIGKNVLLPFERDLLSDDGMKDYGKCVDYVSIISCDEYKTYRDYINYKSNWWWTLTPWTCRVIGSSYIRCVYTDGSLYANNKCSSRNGVSLLLLFSPSLRVKLAKTKNRK